MDSIRLWLHIDGCRWQEHTLLIQAETAADRACAFPDPYSNRPGAMEQLCCVVTTDDRDGSLGACWSPITLESFGFSPHLD
ncbi:MAG: hypothetical protein WCD51_02000, partial [Anaerolineae bacterium]